MGSSRLEKPEDSRVSPSLCDAGFCHSGFRTGRRICGAGQPDGMDEPPFRNRILCNGKISVIQKCRPEAQKQQREALEDFLQI